MRFVMLELLIMTSINGFGLGFTLAGILHICLGYYGIGAIWIILGLPTFIATYKHAPWNQNYN